MYKIEKRKLSLNLEGIPIIWGKQNLMLVDIYEVFVKFFLTKYIAFEDK